MRIAILGATSQIAKDLVRAFRADRTYDFVLYARRPSAVTDWLSTVGLRERYAVADFKYFSSVEHFDAVLNFVGVGNPAQAAAMGATIFEATLQYDELALGYLRQHPHCRYIFISSGAVFGSSFDKPVSETSMATFPINSLAPQDWYGIAKMYAECRHRSLPHLPIVDIRIFNYFSHTQDMSARFLLTDVVRAIRKKAVLQTSSDNIVRDFIHPEDFHQLIIAILSAQTTNVVVDAYSKAPVDKSSLLKAIVEQYGLRYETTQAPTSVNATGNKVYYYSSNTKAAEFGFKPTLTSLDGVMLEINKCLAPL